MDYDAAEEDAGFFPDFAAHGFFDAFGRFAEAGEGGVPVGWPALLAAKEDSFRVVAYDGHYYWGY